MPRVSKPLALSEDDLIALEKLKAYGDQETCLRAEIVLACGENKTNKSIAQELSVTEVTVKRWKEAFRERGLKGLESGHSGGRPSSSPVPDELEGSILRILAESTEEKLTAAMLAERLQVDVQKVYYVLRKHGINLSRSRCWEYISRDDMDQWNPPVLCLYLSPACDLIVTSSDAWSYEDKSLEGVFVTQDRKLKDALESSVIPASLAGLLKTVSDMPEKPSGRDVKPGKPGSVIAEAISQWNANKEAEFFIFSSGDSFRYEGIRAKQCHVYHYESMDEMITGFNHWMGGRCNSGQHVRTEALMEGIRRLTQKRKSSSQPFVWYLKQKEGDEDCTGPEESAASDMAEGEGDALVFSNAKSWSSVEEMLTELLPEMDSTDPVTEAGAVLYQRGNDGKLSFRLVQSKRKFQAMEEFNFETKDGFENDMSRLEDDTEAFLHEIASANYEMFLDGSKKNKT